MSLRIFLLFAIVAVCCHPCRADDTPTRFARPVLIRFAGEIDPASERYLDRKLAIARNYGADLLIMEIDSPGGYVDTTEDIAHRLRDIDWAHTVAFVPAEAISGASIISLGCDDIVMGRNARWGDAGVIFAEGGAFHYAPEKARTALARTVRDLAAVKGRSPALAEALVDMDLEVFYVTHKPTGDVFFMSELEIETADHPGDWEKGKLVLESRKERFLEVNGPRAVELGLASGLADNRLELAKLYQVDELLVLEATPLDKTVALLNSWLVVALLLLVGGVSLYFELSAPGITIGGLISGLCFALFFWSTFMGGTAGWLEVILFAAGCVFLIVEIFVIPGFGVPGIAGLLLMLVSLVLARHDFIVPHNREQAARLMSSVWIFLGTAVFLLVAAVLITRRFGRIPILHRLALQPGVDKDDPGKVEKFARPEQKPRIQEGDWAIADSPLRPAGKVMFGNDYFDVVTEGGFVDKGSQVRVVKVSGNRIVVRQVDEATEVE